MAKRFTDTGKWDKKWFRELKPKYKCFWDYITCKCDIAGIWEVDFEAAHFYIKEELSKEDVLDVIKDQIYIISDKKWLIKDFILFQYGAERLETKSPIHRKIIEILIKNNLYDSLSSRIDNRVAGRQPLELFDDEKKQPENYENQSIASNNKKNKKIDDGRVLDSLCNRLQEKEKDKEEEEVKEEEEEGTHELQIFVSQNLPHVSKIKKQLTFNESSKLIKSFGIDLVKDILQRMDNKHGIEKKYNTVYQTCRGWCDNDFATKRFENKINKNSSKGAEAKNNEKIENIDYLKDNE